MWKGLVLGSQKSAFWAFLVQQQSWLVPWSIAGFAKPINRNIQAMRTSINLLNLI